MANIFGAQDMAAGYATSRPPVHPHVVERIRKYLGPEKRFHRALDVGCGAGLSTKPLLRVAEQCIGIEPAESMLKWNQAVAPEAQFVGGTAENIPLRSRSIDLITAAGSLNYADLNLFFPEAKRVLAPSGRLVVYDFSQGRSFRDSESLAGWFVEFVRRYPKPSNGAKVITPESLAAARSGFRLEMHEEFEIDLPLTPEFYLDYVMTETNVAFAASTGTPLDDIRSWCAESLSPVFGGRSRIVIFRGYIAHMVPA
jgi:SAM-dependent methyltransferase